MYADVLRRSSDLADVLCSPRPPTESPGPQSARNAGHYDTPAFHIFQVFSGPGELKHTISYPSIPLHIQLTNPDPPQPKLPKTRPPTLSSNSSAATVPSPLTYRSTNPRSRGISPHSTASPALFSAAGSTSSAPHTSALLCLDGTWIVRA